MGGGGKRGDGGGTGQTEQNKWQLKVQRKNKGVVEWVVKRSRGV